MKGLINIEALTKDSSKRLGNLIQKIFTSGMETGMDQSTIVEALGIIPQVFDTINSVEGCTLIGEKHTHVKE